MPQTHCNLFQLNVYYYTVIQEVQQSMAVYGIYLENATRRFSGIFPLEAAGGIESHPFCSGSERGKLELCIRLSGENLSMKESYNGVETELRYPNVLIKVPHVERKYVLDHPRDVIFFRYNPELLDELTDAGLISKPYAWHFEMTPEISRKLREVDTLLHAPNVRGIADQLDLLALTLWELLLIERDSGMDDGSDNAEARIRQVAAYLQVHFADEVDIGVVARKNGFSERNFFRCWKKHFTITPAEYIRGLKFAEAERLLTETNLPVMRIAEMLGFHTAGYFCDLFRRYRGMTPLKLRQNSSRD